MSPSPLIAPGASSPYATARVPFKMGPTMEPSTKYQNTVELSTPGGEEHQ